MLNSIKNFIMGAGINKEIVEEIQPRIDEHNWHCIKIFCSLAIFFYGIMVIVAILSPVNNHKLLLYLFGFVLSLICFILSKFISHNRSFLVLTIMVFVSSMFLFGILSGSLYGPHESGTTYVAFIFAVPLFFCIRPLYVLGVLFVSDILFIIFCLIYKDPEIVYNDIVNTIIFSVISLVISTIVGRRQINQIILKDTIDKAHAKEIARNKDLELHCNFDVMTGLENFFSYRALCHGFSESELEKPVGVIFADLNRLKYINDTEGHEAGNVYIKSFATKIKDNFEDFNKYRISGDEFLIVNQNIDSDSFIERAKNFDSLIKSDNIPTASIGYAYGNVCTIEEITTLAEKMMYDDKHLFYEKFPKFKRAIAEVQYQNEMNALVKVLTNSYETLMLIDLEVDEYRVMKKSETSVALGEDDRGVYSLRNINFCNLYVDDEYRELRENIGSIENLKKQLLTEEHITCDYKLKNGQWREAVFWKMEIYDNEVTKVIYYSQDLDEAMAKRMEKYHRYAS